MSLRDRLVRLIETGGPVTVSAYMTLCLHDPAEGYYAQGAGLGRDFITAPETSQIFGELLGLWAVHEWQAMGRPETFALAELGPGSGTLLRDALRASTANEAFHKGLSLRLVEASPALREAQSERLGEWAPDHVEALDAIESGHTLILANEFLDCLPARQFVRNGENWHERVIGLDDTGQLSFGLGGPVPLPGGSKEAGDYLEIQPGLETLVLQLAHRLERGDVFRALFIDYGPDDHTPGDTLRAYSRGAQIHPLAAPGTSDLTVDVDFDRLKRLAETAGLEVYGPVTQSAFLMTLGAEARMQALIEAQPEKAETIYAGAAKLIDPSEMGNRFKVICLASPGLPVPAGFGEN